LAAEGWGRVFLEATPVLAESQADVGGVIECGAPAVVLR
jgi:hypothetical protein